MGFTFDDTKERCECDLLMNSKLLTIRDCDINNQSVLRPANSWISAEAHNNSYFYHVSPIAVHFNTAYLIHRILISPLLIHNVS